MLGGQLVALLVRKFPKQPRDGPATYYRCTSLPQKTVRQLSVTSFLISLTRIDCADTSIIRTPSRQELLYTRSQIAVTAKAFGLEAIDMVSMNRTIPATVLIQL